MKKITITFVIALIVLTGITSALAFANEGSVFHKIIIPNHKSNNPSAGYLTAVSYNYRNYPKELSKSVTKDNGIIKEKGLTQDHDLRSPLKDQEPAKIDSIQDISVDKKVNGPGNKEEKVQATTKANKPQPKKQEAPKVETKTQQKAKSKVDSKPQAKPKAETKPKAQPKAKSKPKAQPKTESKPKAQPKTEPKLKTEAKPDPKPKAESATKEEPKPKAKSEPKAESKPEAESQPKEEPKPEPEPKKEDKPSLPKHGVGGAKGQLIDKVNTERINAGLKPLKWDSKLAAVAQDKAADMVDNNYFAHNSPTYGSPFEMMKSYGIKYSAAAENLAGTANVDRAHSGLMNSDGHRKNIMNSKYTHIGIGIEKSPKYGYVYVQMFIKK